jgi:hypothetical protein
MKGIMYLTYQMSGKNIRQKELLIPKQLMPSLLNRRRINLKKFLSRYMGLPFTQAQPVLHWEDMEEAGMLPVYDQLVRQLFPHSAKRKFEAEPVGIEVRGVALALDEEISFSPYRYQSLQSPLYRMPYVPNLQRYQAYCHFWGEIIGGEESVAIARKLRMRTIHDFMQDMLPVVHHMPLLRLSVYDLFGTGENARTLHEILSEEDTSYYPFVADYLAAELERIDLSFPLPF